MNDMTTSQSYGPPFTGPQDLQTMLGLFRERPLERFTGQKNGYTDPIATHPDFQRRGLSKALLLCGLSLLKARGMLTAHLGTSSENSAILHCAESVGFHTTHKVFFYQKPIHIT